MRIFSMQLADGSWQVWAEPDGRIPGPVGVFTGATLEEAIGKLKDAIVEVR